MRQTRPNHPARLLVVDDEMSLRNLFKLALEDENLQVDLAVNGLEALDCLKRSHYDLILLDLNMPVLSGLDVVEKLNAQEIFPKVILASAFIPDSALLRAISLGVTTFLAKPMTLDQLRATVQGALEPSTSSLREAFQRARSLAFAEAAKILDRESVSPEAMTWKQTFQLLAQKSRPDALLPIKPTLTRVAFAKA